MTKKQLSFLSAKKIWLLIFFLASHFLHAQFRMDLNEEPKRLYYDYLPRVKKIKDMKDFRDVFHCNKYLMGKRRIMGNISYNSGRVLVDDGKEKHSEIRNALGFYTRIRFFEEFSVNTIFFKDFNPGAAAPWIADYNYSIGRYNWRPKRINFGYENYINNKYSDSPQQMKNKFLLGYYYLSYNLPSSKKLNKLIHIDSTSSFSFTPFMRYSIKYGDDRTGLHGNGIFGGKTIAGIAMRYTIVWGIYFESAVYYYFMPNEKMKWDPDYTYGFGYFNWRPFRVSITYGNWAINRFSWNKNFYPDYDFKDGQFKIGINWNW